VTTLPLAWARGWAAEPDRPVLLAGHDRWLGRDVAEQTAARARRLAALGVVAGDRVVVSAPTTPDLVLAHVALLRLGAVVVPVNPAAAPRELSHVMEVVRPVAAVTDRSDRFAGRKLLVVTPDLPLPAGGEVPLDASPPGAAALVAFTSGTTGTAKGAVHTHATLAAGCRSLVSAWQWSPDDRLVHALPLFHVHGLCVGLYGSLLAGASLALLPGFDVDGVLDAVSEPTATLFFGVPTMYERLLRSPRAGALGRLRLLVSGSAPLPAPLFARVERASGSAPVERYGMTETLMLTSNPLDGERRPGTVGLPLPGVEVRLAGDGQVEVRGPNVFEGYWQDPDADREAFTEDGWFRTGDVGQLDDVGYLRLVGRSSELIISGGFNVYPREVEDVLRQVDGVRDVAVAGVPDDEWGEVVTAFVVGPAGEQDLVAAAAAGLSPYKRPRAWRRLDELPRNAMGKVERRRLLAT
jgi:malonyl-CoA/methylmalonyl-CoA synthetase